MSGGPDDDLAGQRPGDAVEQGAEFSGAPTRRGLLVGGSPPTGRRELAPGFTNVQRRDRQDPDGHRGNGRSGATSGYRPGERALKANARELGISEAELVWRMLDGLLLEVGERTRLVNAGAADALEDFLAEVDNPAEFHSFPEAYRFDRKELYEERT